jgi:hypothetical protein
MLHLKRMLQELQVFYMDIAKVDRDVAYVAMVVHVCCKFMFSMFHSDVCCKCVYLDVMFSDI